MNITQHIAQHGFEAPEDPEVTQETQYGVAYWNGTKILEDYASEPGGLDTLYSHTAANYGEGNVTLVTREVIITRVTGYATLMPPPSYDCDACGDSEAKGVLVYIDPSDPDETRVALCEDCKGRPHNTHLVQVVA